jgi:hypothetical protein
MPTYKKDMEIYRKTTNYFELHFKKDGIAEDITGWTVYFTVKEPESGSFICSFTVK